MNASNQPWTTSVSAEPGLRIVLAIVLTLALAITCCIHIYEEGLNGPPIRADGFGYLASFHYLR